METSPTTKELTAALCQFQSAQIKVAKTGKNPAFKSAYATLPQVLDAVLPTLTESGLCFVQFPDGEALTTRLLHVSGEWMQASYTLKPAQNTPQASGSALTYARRYALLAILGLGTEDDDGQAASQAPAPRQQGAPAASDELKNELRNIIMEVLKYGANQYASDALAKRHTLSAEKAEGGLAFFKKELHRLSLIASQAPGHD